MTDIYENNRAVVNQAWREQLDAAEPYPATMRGCAVDGVDVPLTCGGWPGEALPTSWAYMCLGFVPQLAELAGSMRPKARVVVIERDWRWMRSIMDHYDMTEFLKRDNMTFLCQEDPVKCAAALSSMADRLNRSVTLVVPFVDLDMEWKVKQMRRCVDYSDVHRTHLLTMVGNSAKSGANVVENLPDYLSNSTIMPLTGIMEDVPAVCVAAGPSLDKQLPLLRTLYDERRCVILAASTTLVPLLKHEIVPDFVCALDWSDLGEKFFDLIDLPETLQGRQKPVCVFDAKVGPGVRKAAAGFRRIYTGNPWLSTLIDHQDMPHSIDLPGSTVAHLSVALAGFMGCSPIITIGYDFAFTGEKYYSESIFKAHTWKESFKDDLKAAIENKSEALRPVPSVGGGTVYVDAHMQAYLSEFLHLAAAMQRRGQNLIDCTEGGAVKHGVEVLPCADVAAELMTTDCSAEINKALAMIVPHGDRHNRQAWTLLRKRLDELRKYRHLLRKMLASFGTLDGQWWTDHALVDRMRKRITNLNKQLVRQQRAAALMRTWAAAAMLHRQWELSDIEEEGDELSEEDRRMRQFNVSVVACETLAAGTTQMINAIQQSLSVIGHSVGE